MELSHTQRMDTLQKQLQEVLTVLHSSPSFIDPNAGVLGSGPSHSSSSHTNEPHRQRQMKLDFIRFACGEPTDWLFAIERYFCFYNIPNHEHLLLVSFNMDPPASSWFHSLDQDGLIPDWTSFIIALHRRFGPTKFEDPAVAIAKLQQTDTVTEYYVAFEQLSRKIPGLSVTVKKGLFLAGLKSIIRCSVLVHRPQDVHDALAYAKVYEEKLTGHRCKGRASLLYLDGSEDDDGTIPPDGDPPP
ncbi:uncharacterized protein LOC133284719 [Gastrolobium bilobum]|uniref:uncharacterized protein LOC133284719 n=1 Tax=Gastrolobium bilobum TaxID=150636 RepID=UPI002AAF9281|nr:uncharacterized protein LOC133284719 [Gastrolobium bilobum]